MITSAHMTEPTDVSPFESPTPLWNRGDVWRIFGLFVFGYIVVNIAVGVVVFINDGDITIGATVANVLGMTIALAGSVLLINRFRPKHSLTKLGFQSTTTNWLAISAALGVLVFLRIFPIQALAEAVPALTVGLESLMEMLVFDTVLETVTVALLTSFIVPFYEEFFFRSYVQNALSGRFGRWGGIIGSGLLFGLFHIFPLQAISAVPLGILAAWLYDRTGSLWPAIILHIVNNFIATGIMPFFQ